METTPQHARADMIYKVGGEFSDNSDLLGYLTLSTPQGPVTGGSLTVLESPILTEGYPLHPSVNFFNIIVPTSTQSGFPLFDEFTISTTPPPGPISYTLELDIRLTSFATYPPVSPPFLYSAEFTVAGFKSIPLSGFGILTFAGTTVPEPSAFWLAACGICGGVFAWSRHRRAQRRQRPVTPPEATE